MGFFNGAVWEVVISVFLLKLSFSVLLLEQHSNIVALNKGRKETE